MRRGEIRLSFESEAKMIERQRIVAGRALGEIVERTAVFLIRRMRPVIGKCGPVCLSAGSSAAFEALLGGNVNADEIAVPFLPVIFVDPLAKAGNSDAHDVLRLALQSLFFMTFEELSQEHVFGDIETVNRALHEIFENIGMFLRRGKQRNCQHTRQGVPVLALGGRAIVAKLRPSLHELHRYSPAKRSARVAFSLV
jgi:hypothetical protein